LGEPIAPPADPDLDGPVDRNEARPHPTRLSDFVLGSQDGIVNVLGIILGLAAAVNDSRIILIATLAALGAESIAMSAVAYSSTLTRRRLYLSQRQQELREMRETPAEEREDIRRILTGWGYEGPDREELVERLCRNPKAMLELMMSFELRLTPVEESAPRESGLLVGGATVFGHLIPLVPFFFVGNDILLGAAMSILFSAVALFGTGWYEARVTQGIWYRNGLQMVSIGLAGGLAGYLIGRAIGGFPGGL